MADGHTARTRKKPTTRPDLPAPGTKGRGLRGGPAKPLYLNSATNGILSGKGQKRGIKFQNLDRRTREARAYAKLRQDLLADCVPPGQKPTAPQIEIITEICELTLDLRLRRGAQRRKMDQGQKRSKHDDRLMTATSRSIIRAYDRLGIQRAQRTRVPRRRTFTDAAD
jgi:hypothetical protein